jgi:CheY-like chemotaxis protein
MNPALPHGGPTRRVLIVDDEARDWAEPMRDALMRAVRVAGLPPVRVEIATHGEAARKWIASENFHVVSLDMRLPERANEIVSVETGLKLAKEFTAIGFPKVLIYSQTLSEPRRTQTWDDSDAVMMVPADTYAKPSGATQPPQLPAGMLSVRAWAQRVVEYLDPGRLQLAPDRGDATGKLTVLGVQLKRGPALLPPTLARCVVRLAEDGHAGAGAQPMIARLVQETARLAVAQSAVLCARIGQPTVLPEDGSLAAALNALRRMLPALPDWNWAHYASPSALDALEAFSRQPAADEFTASVALHHCLDIGAYWVRHPVCTDLRYSRDGWTALPLRGATLPRRRDMLPAAQDFGAAADSAAPWQGVWTLGSGADDQPRHQVIDWSAMLQRDAADDKRWWLRLWQAAGQASQWLNIDDGRVAPR